MALVKRAVRAGSPGLLPRLRAGPEVSRNVEPRYVGRPEVQTGGLKDLDLIPDADCDQERSLSRCGTVNAERVGGLGGHSDDLGLRRIRVVEVVAARHGSRRERLGTSEVAAGGRCGPRSWTEEYVPGKDGQLGAGVEGP